MLYSPASSEGPNPQCQAEAFKIATPKKLGNLIYVLCPPAQSARTSRCAFSRGMNMYRTITPFAATITLSGCRKFE